MDANCTSYCYEITPLLILLLYILYIYFCEKVSNLFIVIFMSLAYVCQEY